MERVCIFIDGSNFYYGLRHAFGKANINFSKLAQELCGTRTLIRMYYYNAPVDKNDAPEKYKNQQRFFNKLNDTPYLTVKLGRLEKRFTKTPNGQEITTHVEKGVDVTIAVDLLKFAHNNAYDTGILISGDGDFASAIEAAKDFGKHIENAFFNPGYSYHLKQACDKFIDLTPLIPRCFLY